MEKERITYFHMPHEGPYDPIAHAGLDHPVTAEGYVPLARGDEVTVEGYQEQFRVVRVWFHHGHPADLAGLHVFLQEM